MKSWNTEDLQGNENTLYDTAIVDTCHYTFIKTHRMYNTKSEDINNKETGVVD